MMKFGWASRPGHGSRRRRLLAVYATWCRMIPAERDVGAILNMGGAGELGFLSRAVTKERLKWHEFRTRKKTIEKRTSTLTTASWL